ncbi:MAG: hypothetical protein IJ849_12875 [Selenomonadaceae bacterium]|nr:hypothetical protein [Selenomonadaceae bacterium]
MATVDNELFTAGALLFGALAACQKNALSPHDVVDYLQVGDMVIYKKERCLVKSVSINEIKLVGNKDVTTIVPEKLFNHIVPFYC